MINTSDDKDRAKTAKDAGARSKRRAEEAQVVTGLQSVLESDEQLFAFSRGLIAGGLRGKLTVGFEALFAPYVNIGLTERRVVLQHVQPESGKPNEILPHSFPLSELHSVAFSDIETFGGEAAGRLNLRLFNDQFFRLRFRGQQHVDNAKRISEVFTTLTSSRPRARTSPTQSLCPHCDQILDRVSRFCPYCGQTLDTFEPEPAKSGEDAADRSCAGATAATDNSADDAIGRAAGEATTTENARGSKRTREWARATPSVETVAAETAPDMVTEGHEAAAPTGDPEKAKTEGEPS